MSINFYGKRPVKKEELVSLANQILNEDEDTARQSFDTLVSSTRICIGKSTLFFKFLFDSQGKAWESIEEFKKFLSQYEITDENGLEHTQGAFWEVVQDDQHLPKRNGKLYYEVEGFDFAKESFC